MPNSVDLVWRDFPQGVSALTAIREWLGTLAPSVREDVAGQIVAKRRLALRGQLDPYDPVLKSGDVRFLATKPFMWEIRWSVEGLELRQYHGEPVSLPDHLIATHFHVKEILETKQETFDAQQEEINKAYDRFSSGESILWGCNCE